ncbi:phospholipase A2 inhibitor gamma subunit B-like isoform X2 [Hemiscyllium ocellatum]|uniref:phospholipase A2 inhibitor gamma subunit B-like isoform X2 n=1 Tax=Hemiscyllium ocellatum TaxID=170820 RepID=UPI0029669323|nr:phospholipase A2 inhibitor gamma subunit B-like isoform X2 [Hemiscyllium ocellatum]
MLQRYLKTLYPTILLSSLLSEVRPLTCHECSATSGECNLKSVICLSEISTCRTTSIITILDGQPNQVIRNSCGSCSDPLSINTGAVILSEKSSCCDSELCNDRTVVEARNATRNGLECRGCFGDSAESCRRSERTVQCVGAETHCGSVSGLEAVVSSGKAFFAKGCVSKRFCQTSGSLSEFRVRFDTSPSCCGTDLCNSESGSTTPNPGCIIGSTVGIASGVVIALVICYYYCRKIEDSVPI